MPVGQGSVQRTAWQDEMSEMLVANGMPAAEARAWGQAVPFGFAAAHAPDETGRDVGSLLDPAPSARWADSGGATVLRLAWADRPSLSHVIAVLDRLGVQVDNHTEWKLEGPDGRIHRLDDFTVGIDGVSSADAGSRLLETLMAVLSGRSDDDGFNRLVLAAGLEWHHVVWVRCWYRYLRQTGFPLGLTYVQDALTRHPAAVASLVAYFTARFDPHVPDRAEAQAAARSATVAAVAEVHNRDDVRILLAGLTVIDATLRSNAFLLDDAGTSLPRVSLKIDSAQLDWAPKPRPYREVFVHAPDSEGIHLRASAVSRGGIRWSDRPEDLRTEVLGLMKAQHVKNAGIVPGGAKGGFVLRRPADGDPGAAARGAYGQFIRGLLDLTDNVVDGAVVRPPALVVHDGDDPYLVVAADKGTATFSDVANGIAAEYDFWLGDAFASGGSAGFDHKKLGITARGAWESLVRHLGECGMDPQRDPFTLVGIGDMSGDVFGNGMLLSPTLRLVAAFDHRHVFVDPEPDAARAYAERLRLAALPRSSWADYDASALSAGGGVFRRDAASVRISDEARAALGLEDTVMATDELVRAVLRAPVDVLFNGGVGTYVKASTELNADAGDPARDSQRVDATDLRARVVVEGGNLGLTQRARVEFAQTGGRVNTDFLDNSAGVSTSDREVNLKIHLDAQVSAGGMTTAERDQQLRDVVDDVTRAVLADSAAQARAVSIAEEEAPALLDRHRQLIRVLQRQGRLDPAVEHLPDEGELDRRRAAGLGLTRPELALLLAYSKDVVRDDLLASNVLDEEDVAALARDYLPAALRTAGTTPFERHPLHREITATVVANQVVNRVGSSFIDRLEELTSRPTPEVVRAFVVVSSALGVDQLWTSIEELDTAQHARTQTALLIALRHVLESECLWLLRAAPHPLDVAAQTAFLLPGARRLLASDTHFLPPSAFEQVARAADSLRSAGAPDHIADATAALSAPLPLLAVAHLAADLGLDAAEVGRVHLLLGAKLSWADLLDTAAPHAADEHARHVASAAVRLTIEQHGLELVRQYLADRAEQGHDTAASVDDWLKGRRHTVDRYLVTIGAIRSASGASLPHLIVAAHELGNVVAARPA